MRYRKFGNTSDEVSILGLDISPLPHADATGTNTAIALIQMAIDYGVNYLDLGPPDPVRQYDGISTLVGTALRNGYRERIMLAAHIPVTSIVTAADLDKLLDRQLVSLQQTSFDCLVLDGLNRNTWPVLRDKGALPRAEAAVTDGRIGRLGFAYRDQFHYLRLLLEDYAGWNFGQFQYSYMDVDRNPGLSGIRHVREQGMAVVIADPLRGGLLAREPPAAIASIWAGAEYERTLTEWGLRWVWNHPEITTVICDLQTTSEVNDLTTLASKVEANSLGIREQLLINQVRDAYRKLRPIPCTTCRTCMPCPQDIDVPRILELYNDAVMFGDAETLKSVYKNEQHSLEDCDECGSCVQSCGRMIAILEWLRKADDLLGDTGTES